MDDGTDLCVETLEVLSLLVELNVDDSLLEVECVTHLVEQECQEEVTPVLIERKPPRRLLGAHTFAKLVTVGDDPRHVASHHASEVQERVEPGLV